MSKKVSKLLAVIFTLFCLVVMLSACNKIETISLKIVGDKTDFTGVYEIPSYYLKGDVFPLTRLTSKNYLERFSSVNASLYSDLKSIVNNEYVAPINSTFTFDKRLDNPFVITNDICGKQVDEKQLYFDIIEGLSSKNITLSLKYEDIKADKTKEYYEEITSLRGSYSTLYSSSSSSRKHNIRLAINRINNSVIKKGEQFSFNKIVGKRTLDNGFQSATIIADGKFVKGVGGGICQVSTTMYNACLLSDILVTEARQHSLPVGYVEPSFDAMVSSWSDLKFTNQTDYPIYILASCDGDRIDIKIYGQKMDYEVKRISEITEVVPYESKQVLAGEYHKGKNGIKSTGKLVYYRGKEKLFEKQIRKDYYKPQDEVIIID